MGARVFSGSVAALSNFLSVTDNKPRETWHCGAQKVPRSVQTFFSFSQKAEAQLAYELQAAKIQQRIRNEEIQIQVRAAPEPGPYLCRIVCVAFNNNTAADRLLINGEAFYSTTKALTSSRGGSARVYIVVGMQQYSEAGGDDLFDTRRKMCVVRTAPDLL